MSQIWQTLDRYESTDGLLELRRRGASDFLICINGRVLMNSRASRSEEALGIAACSELKPGSRVLVGGLGMGLTLRAVMDCLSSESRVTVAELHPVIVEWCRGPLAGLTDSILGDPRISLRISDVADQIREAADADRNAAYDAIVMDLFEGPHAKTDARGDPLYGERAIDRTWRALAPEGVFSVWAEARDAAFESRLRKRGFSVDSRRPGRGGLRHWIVFARRSAAS